MMLPPPLPLGAQALPRPHPIDRRACLLRWPFSLMAISLVIAFGIFGWHVGRLAAPTVVEWQINIIDARSDAPEQPRLPEPLVRR